MTSGEPAAFSAKIDAVLAEQERLLDAVRQRGADRAARGTADAAAATARLRRLAERVRQGARDRARPSPREALAFDDPVAELEALAKELDGTPPDPDEPAAAEVEEIVATLRPPAPEDQPDTAVRRWSNRAGSAHHDAEEP